MIKVLALIPFAGALAVAGSAPASVTFHKDVEPILQSRCQECHRPGEIAPFALMSYKDARPWAKAIKENVLNKKMPPWFADPRYGHFANDRSLSQEEIQTLAAWADHGAPEGDVKDAPPPRHFVEGWNIPKPDYVISMPAAFPVPKSGDVPYQYIVLPTGFTEDKWVQMAEGRPSDRSVVHHIVVFVREPGSKWLRDAKPRVPFVPEVHGKDFINTTGGGSDILMIYTPGMIPEIWKPGMAKQIKAGSDLVLQVHYTANGKNATEDQSKVGLVFAKEPPTEKVITLGSVNMLFKIPPGDPNYKVAGATVVPIDATLLSVFPHMHLRGKSFEMKAIYPTGEEQTLLEVPTYDFFWQLDYKLKEPLKIPAGTKMVATAYFDNSLNNPKNPDPAATVTFGEQSWEEMMIGFYDLVVPASVNPREIYMHKPKAKTTE